MIRTKRMKSHIWDRLKLRGRLLAMMLAVALAAVLICALSFGVTYYRMLTLSQDHARALSNNVYKMVEMAFYQQESYIRKVYTLSQANLLDQRLSELSAKGRQPDWNALLAEAYDLINDPIDAAEEYDGPGNLEEEGATVFIWTGKEFYVQGTDEQTFMKTADDIYKRATEQGNTSDRSLTDALRTWKSNAGYVKGEDGMLLAWYSFGAGEYRVGMFVPNTGAFQMSAGLQELMAHETGLALERMNTAARRSVLGLLLALAVLLVVLPLASRRLALVVVNPVEREQERQRDLLRNAEEENAMLERINQMKTEFLANISHEMKTPLTVISGYAQDGQQALQIAPEYAEVEQGMKLIVSEANRLALMVSQVLDVSRIEEGRMTFDIRPHSIVEVTQETLNRYAPIICKNRNEIRFAAEDDLPLALCDSNRIGQVLVNLLSNAARHTLDGIIAVELKRSGDAVCVSVSDTGEGIAPEQLPLLFERFKTANKKAHGGKETGTGLGLYICKHIVKEHGGGIQIESQPGKGTEVTFTLPLHTEP